MMTSCRAGHHTFILVGKWKWRKWWFHRERTLECVYCFTTMGLYEARNINGSLWYD